MIIQPASFAVVIPARYASSRFPGKPLVEIAGKPMIQHVWERSALAVGSEKVYVATDDSRIHDAARDFGANVVMTSSTCITGTDRLAEANKELGLDFLVNVQGDEPLVEPRDITAIVESFSRSGNITNAMASITTEAEFSSRNVPKVVFNQRSELLYMSRAPIPNSKSSNFVFGYKQVCIYAFSRQQLEFFGGHSQKSPFEALEDIEILRFLEAGYTVDMIEVEEATIAVDVPEDVDRVLEKLGANHV